MTHTRLDVYNASAGSGKTYTLVKKYLRLLLEDASQPFRYSHILAITFTNDATSEMKKRILETLYLFSSASPEAYPQLLLEFADAFKCSPKVLQERSKRILTHILNHYTDFNITTIDSFFTKIIRNYAQELDLGFNIGFELEIDDSLEQAIDLILEQIEHNESRRTLQSMMKQLIQNSFTFKIKTILTEATKLLYKESHYFELKQLQDIDFDAPRWVQSLESSSKQLMALALELCETTENLILNEGVKLSDFSGGSRGIGYFWNKFK